MGYSINYNIYYGSTSTTSIINSVRSSCTATTTLCVACYATSNPSILLTVACGNCLSITTQTSHNSPRYINGAYFYFTSSYSFGFADTSTIQQNQADVYNGGSALRISWHLDLGCGGWRCGSSTGLNSASTYSKLLLKL